MLPIAVFLLAQASSSLADDAAAEIQENPALMRTLEAKTGAFVRCGRRALESRIASEAGSTDLSSVSPEAAADMLTRAMHKAVQDCDVDGNAARIVPDIRNALPNKYQPFATDAARAYLYQLIGMSLWGVP